MSKPTIRNLLTLIPFTLLLHFSSQLHANEQLHNKNGHDEQPSHDVYQLSDETMPTLDNAWQALIDGLIKARETLVLPEHFPPAVSDRGLAEGYRYMLGHLNRSIEFEFRADPQFPEFFRSMNMLRKWTGENPDAMYLKAPIDSTGYYKITAKAANTKEWKTSIRGVKGPKAPRLVTFQTITDVPGHTGELAEMAECKSQTVGFINSFELDVDKKGRFELLIGPKKPEGYKGSFLLSKKLMTCASTKVEAIANARWVAVREIFSDWENEVPLMMDITRLDSIGKSRPPITVEQVAEKIHYIAEEIPNQVRFWNLLMEFPLEMARDANNDGKRNLAVNGIFDPELPFTAGGVAGAQQIYSSGIFELEDDEALVIKITSPVEPYYIAIQLNNLWMEGPDQQNYTSSLTGHQLPVASDGSRYFIISKQDPGVQGWVATTGIKKGFHAFRFVFREDFREIELPTTAAYLVKLNDLASILPKDTPIVSEEERRKEIAIRQKHIKLRWRAF